MKFHFLVFFALAFLSCNPQTDPVSIDCMDSDFEPLLISDIYFEIEPALRNFGFELKMTSDGGYILFVPFWGDAYKFNSNRKIEFKLSFNSKSLSKDKDHINHISGTTPAFDVFGDKIYFLQSNQTINVYNLQGKEITNYKVDISDVSISDMKVISEEKAILSGTQMEGSQVVLSFFKKHFATNTQEKIQRILLDPRKNQIFIKLNEKGSQVLIERDSSITELRFDEGSIQKIDFKKAKNRDYNKYNIPNDVDYISLSEEEQRKYRNDKTQKFNFNGNEIIILHEVANKSTIGKPYERLLTKHSLSNGEVGEKLGIDEIIEFDDCGNFFIIEKIEDDFYISKKSWSQIKNQP